MTGRLIVIDGNDGSGKQTQCGLLQAAIVAAGSEVALVSFPRYEETFFGKELKKALRGDYGDFASIDPHLGSLLYAADRWTSKDHMIGCLAHGTHVLCDRYVSANQIHQGGKIADEKKREEFLAWLDQLEHVEYEIPRPDISVYLDVPPHVSRELMSDRTRDMVEDNPLYLENSHSSAQWLIARSPDRWIHIHCMGEDGTLRSRDSIHEEIVAKLKEREVLTNIPVSEPA